MGLDPPGHVEPRWSFQASGERGDPSGPPSPMVAHLQGRNLANGDLGWFPCAVVRPFICVSTGDPETAPTLMSPRCSGSPGIWGAVYGVQGVSQRSHLLSSPTLDPQFCFSPPGSTAGSLRLPLVGVGGPPHCPWGTPNSPLGSHRPWGPPRITL